MNLFHVKTMKKRIISLLIAFAMILVTGCSSNNEPAQVQPQPAAPSASEPAESDSEFEEVVLKLGHQTDEKDPYHLYSLKFKELVEEKTGGKIQIEIYPNGQLGFDRDLIEALQFGNIDLAFVTTSPVSNFASQFGVLDLPYLFRDWDHAEKFIDSEVAKELLNEGKSTGLAGLAIMPRGFRNTTNSKKPILTADDIVGLKLRVIESPAFIKTFEDLGANVSAMSWGEVYTALQQKTIDGQENPPTVIKTYKLSEVQKYLSKTEHIFSFAALMGSEANLSKLPEEVKAVLSEAAIEASLAQAAEERVNESKIIEELKTEGFEVNEVDKQSFIDKIKSPYDWFAGEYGDKYINGIKEIK